MAVPKEHLHVLVDVTGPARLDYEHAYFEWLLESLADTLRQVMVASPDVVTFDRRRDRVLALLDMIEEVQVDALALLAARRLEADQLPDDCGAAGVGRPSAA